MLFSLGKMEVLEDYVHKSSDATLLKVRKERSVDCE